MRKLIIIFMCSSCLGMMGQEVNTIIRVIDSPEFFTPLMDVFHLAGDLNEWNPADPTFQFDHSGEFPELMISGQQGESFNYKITRGSSWSTVEANADGSYLIDRTAVFTDGIIDIIIEGWEEFPTPHTATANTRVITSNFYMPELDRYRRIWIVLPSNYYGETENYPVIYMHDAQNLFSSGNSFVGEWGVDETLLELESGCLKAIVVGIDNGEGQRIDEYAPWVNNEYGGGEGEAYVDFLANTLKPFIDEEFRTLVGPEQTGLIGSSLGGLISCYAAKKYPTVFGKLGLFSPAFWFNPELFDYVSDAPVNNNQRYYFIAGSSESASMVPLMNQMVASLIDLGHSEENVFVTDHADGAHSEWYWGRELPEALEWLFCNSTTSISSQEAQATGVKIYPNPSSDSLTIELASGIRKIEILNMTGQVVYSKDELNHHELHIQHDWPEGIYTVQLLDLSGKFHQSTLKCN